MKTFKKNSLLNFFFIGIFLLYAVDLIFQYLNVDLNFSFGYLDQQAHWQSMHDLIRGNVIYRDFIWEYGIFMLIIRLPIYILLGQTYLANLVNNYFFLPALGIALSFVLAKQYVDKKSLIVVLGLALIYKTTNDYNSVRHLIPELGLMLLMTGLINSNKKNRIIGSILLGISLTSSPEYAIIGSLSYFFFLFLYLLKTRKHIFTTVIQTCLAPFLIGVSYLIYLSVNGTIGKMLVFHLEHVKAFYTDSPCREFFPRFNTLQDIFLTPENFIFNFLTFTYRLNLYVVPLIMIVLAVMIFRNRKSKWFLADLAMLVYSMLAFTRTINTPCYIHYGLFFIFILTAKYACSHTVSKRTRVAAAVMIIWLVIASGYMSYIRQAFGYFSKPPLAQREYLPVAGIMLEKKYTEEYKYIMNYIEKNSAQNDLLFVYPDGPYNLLTGHESPTASFSTLYSSLVPSIESYSYEELTVGKPKFIIINKYNSSSYKSAVHGVAYNIHSSGKNVIFRGMTTKIEEYINENYDVVEKLNLAWILERTTSAKKPTPFLVPVQLNQQWGPRFYHLEVDGLQLTDTSTLRVTGPNPELTLSNSLKNIAVVSIPMKFDLGAIKPFSKFVFQIRLITNDGQQIPLKADFISSDWQDVIIDMPQFEAPREAETIAISVTDNLGFMPWGRPYKISLKPPRTYIVNPDITIDDSIIK